MRKMENKLSSVTITKLPSVYTSFTTIPPPRPPLSSEIVQLFGLLRCNKMQKHFKMFLNYRKFSLHKLTVIFSFLKNRVIFSQYSNIFKCL